MSPQFFHSYQKMPHPLTTVGGKTGICINLLIYRMNPTQPGGYLPFPARENEPRNLRQLGQTDSL